jgi:hypothetical protein
MATIRLNDYGTKAVLSQFALTPGRRLGKGEFCAVYADGPDEVIKLTTDPIQRESVRDYLGGVHFPNMLEDLGCVGTQHAGDLDLYMFKAERLRPTRDADAATRRLARQVIKEVEASLATSDAQASLRGRGSKAVRYAARSDAALKHLVDSKSLPASVVEAFADLQHMTWNYNNLVIDFHGANLMVRGTEELVFNDVFAMVPCFSENNSHRPALSGRFFAIHDTFTTERATPMISHAKPARTRAWLPRIAAATVALSLAASAAASEYFVVVPVKGRAAAGVAKPVVAVTLNASGLPVGAEGEAYPGFNFNSVLQVTGDGAFNPAGVTWAVADGALPVGLSLTATGQLAGTPAGAGTSTFSVRASYRTKSGQQAYQVVVSQVTVALADGRMPLAPVGASYAYDFAQHLSVTGPQSYDANQVAWSAVGPLPTGLALSAHGVLTGTPVLADEGSPVTVQASYKAKSAQKTYTVFPSDPEYGQVSLLMHMDGAAGSTHFGDERGHQFTLVGSPTIAPEGKYSSGAWLNGSSYIQSAYDPGFAFEGDFTVELWANISSHVDYGGLIGAATPNNPQHGWQLIFDFTANTLRFEGESVAMVSAIPLPLTAWAHVALVRKGTAANNVRLYINGALVSTVTYTGKLDGGGAPLLIGVDRTRAKHITGTIDEVRITPTVARYDANFTPSAGPHPAR